jgi:hypothetical protein
MQREALGSWEKEGEVSRTPRSTGNERSKGCVDRMTGSN